MRLYTTLVGLLLAIANPIIATTIKGIIVKNEKGGPGMASVEVSAIGDANPTLTNSDGSFFLEFPKKQPGDTVQLNVQMPGMTVVNASELRVTLTRDSNAAPLIFPLCKDGDVSEMRSRYYDYQNRKKLEESEAEKIQLRIQLDSVTKAAVREKEEREKVEKLSYSSAHLVTPINRSYEAVELNRAANLYRNENRPAEALKAYDEGLKAGRELAEKDPQTYLPDVVELLNNRGDLFSEQNRLAESLEDFNEALKISGELAEKNATYLPSVARIQDYRAALFHKQSRSADERAALEAALGLYRGLARLNPIYGFHVAETLNKLGINNRDEERREEKREAFNEALSIYQRLERENPGEYGQEIESTRGLLEEFFNETLDRALAKLEPGYRPNIAETLTILGKLNLDQNRIGEARRNLSKAFGIYVTLAKENVGQYGQTALSIEGMLSMVNPGPFQQEFEANGRVLEAAFKDSLKSYRSQLQTDPRYRSNVAETLVSLGILARDQNRIADARNNFGEALEIFEPLALAERQHPGPAPWYGSPYDGKVKSTRKYLDDLAEIRTP